MYYISDHPTGYCGIDHLTAEGSTAIKRRNPF